MSQQQTLTTDEQKLNNAWEGHLHAEFNAHSADAAIATMVENVRVHTVPLMIGGDGKQEVHKFYATYFLPQIPPDTEMIPVSRTIGQGRLVEEMVFRFTHHRNGLDVAWDSPNRKAGRGGDAGGRAV